MIGSRPWNIDQNLTFVLPCHLMCGEKTHYGFLAEAPKERLGANRQDMRSMRIMIMSAHLNRL
jgi:hypothetical protein